MDHHEFFAECRALLAEVHDHFGYNSLINATRASFASLSKDDQAAFLGTYLHYIETALADRVPDFDRCFDLYTGYEEDDLDTLGHHLSRGVRVYYNRKGVTKKKLPILFERLEAAKIATATTLRFHGLKDRSVDELLRGAHARTTDALVALELHFEEKYNHEHTRHLTNILDLAFGLWGEQIEVLSISLDGSLFTPENVRDALFSSLARFLPNMSRLKELLLYDVGSYSVSQLTSILDAAPPSLQKLTPPSRHISGDEEFPIIDGLLDHPILNQLEGLRPNYHFFNCHEEGPAYLASKKSPKSLRYFDMKTNPYFGRGYPTWGDPAADFERDLQQKLLGEDHEISTSATHVERIYLRACGEAKWRAAFFRENAPHEPIVYPRLDYVTLNGLDEALLPSLFSHGATSFPRASYISFTFDGEAGEVGEFSMPAWGSVEQGALRGALDGLWKAQCESSPFPNLERLEVYDCSFEFMRSFVEQYATFFPRLKRLSFEFDSANKVVENSAEKLEIYKLLMASNAFESLDSNHSYRHPYEMSDETVLGWMRIIQDEAHGLAEREVLVCALFEDRIKKDLLRYGDILGVTLVKSWNRQRLLDELAMSFPENLREKISNY